MFILRSFIN